MSRIEELKSTIPAGVVELEIRKRSARVQVLQTRLDGMLALSAARGPSIRRLPRRRRHRELVKDYRGKNAEQEIWKFDVALEAQIKDTLKQAAIEEGQWTEKREAKGSDGISGIMERLNAGRKRVADAKAARDAAAQRER